MMCILAVLRLLLALESLRMKMKSAARDLAARAIRGDVSAA
jgi:hypothetical protein